MSTPIGIDLGTTTSIISAYKDGKPIPIKNRMTGKEITQSIISVDKKTNHITVGEEADGQYEDDNVVKEIKRCMGDRKQITLNGKIYSPEDISSMIIKYLKEYAEEYLNEAITEVVITVPANFPIEAKKATEIAAQLAGLNVLRIIQEPTAAALAYGYDKESSDEKILVYDLGGGTFDVSIIELVEGVVDVVAHDGDRHLGGADFDKKVIDYVLDYLKSEYELKIDDKSILHRIKNECKKFKEQLSFKPIVNLNIPFIGIKDNQPINLNIDLSQYKFNELCSDLVSRTIAAVESCLKSAKMKPTDISKVILVGGSTRMPIIKEKVEEYFGFAPTTNIEPDLAVSMGAAIQAGIIKGESDTIIMDRISYGFGVRTIGMFGDQYRDNVYDEIIPPQAQINMEYKKDFITIHDHQKILEVNCYQREPGTKSIDISDMVPIGEPMIIEDLPTEEGRQQDINISMSYNLNGIINVELLIPSSGRKESWEINTSSAESIREDFNIRKEALDNLWLKSKFSDKAKSLINAVESRIEKMNPADRDKTELELVKLKEALVEENEELINECIDTITDILINY